MQDKRQHTRPRVTLGLLGVCVLALMAWSLGGGTGLAAAKTSKRAAAKATVVTVTLGKPTEFGFKLSRSSALPSGQITFKVTNAGKLSHDFKVCTSLTTSATKNACVGQVTKMLATGQSATLTVTLTKAGEYEYLSTAPGHAAAAMKGLLGVGVAATPTASAPGSTQPSSGTSSGTSSSSGSSGGSAPDQGMGPNGCPVGEASCE